MTTPVLSVLTEAEQAEFRGLYWEAVGKIVDELASAIVSGELTSRLAVRARLDSAVRQSEYTDKDLKWCFHVLLFSMFPCAYLSGEFYIRKDSEFPFHNFALASMQEDTVLTLSLRPEFLNLDIRTPALTQAKKTGRLSSAQPNEASSGKPKWKTSNPPTQE